MSKILLTECKKTPDTIFLELFQYCKYSHTLNHLGLSIPFAYMNYISGYLDFLIITDYEFFNIFISIYFSTWNSQRIFS